MAEYFVHRNALCETDDIGKKTRIWAFCHIMKDVSIGEDCNFGDGSFVESGVKIGNRVTVKNGVSIWNGVEIEDDVFLGPNCVLTNDLFPRSKVYHGENIRTYIRKGASIGANATIICGIELGRYCMVAAGAVVTRDVPDFALVAGVPSKVIGYVAVTGEKLDFSLNDTAKDREGNQYLKKGQKIILL